ncbi:MAG: DNA-directed RNA polymerase subunit beta' [Dictyoglomus sp.]|nr:DNA-directed RNA polymerase subunit beta' [Dictyoglomus sp.]MDW8189258.1 DNA-directed RNA polymerase subunit beta' [Dictyoglomus sp.]
MKIKDFDKLVFSLASPEDILSWSYGEVKKPETINYRTLRPERDGLFCEKIFGPVKDFECSCGKYKGQKFEGITCDRCGVTVTRSSVRRERMGHIKLAVPVVHIWYFKNVPNYIALLLNISSKALEEVVYFHSYIVLEPGDTDLQKMQTLSEEDYEQALKKYGNEFKVGMGAEAIKYLLRELDLEKISYDLKKQIEEAQGQKKAKLIKRLEIVESFRFSGNKPEWMILEVLPVIPPDLRPMVELEGGKFATSDLNDLYRRVINRNNRLTKLLEINAPEIIVRNEKRMLQEAVDALIDNGRRGKPVTNASGRALRSLSDILEGKQGRFRQNLLGKRVDYSGRAVIVVGPDLKLHQCGLPKKMALELFKPFVTNKLIEKGFATNVKNAKKKIERESPEVWDVLDEIIKEKLVLLNRAPTLHRLSIQAFEPKLIDGNAIQLHPLVCPPFNADFDGDQMAVHVPLSIEAQAEARLLMLSSYNLLSPAHGKPLTLPTQDIVIGLYYLTIDVPNRKGEGKIFATPEEALMALDKGEIDIHAKIKIYVKSMKETFGVDFGEEKFVETTAGRLILNEILPLKLRYYNGTLNRREIRKIVERCFQEYGWVKTAEFLDDLKKIGFKYATKAGISFSIVDIEIPQEAKKVVIEKAEEESANLQKAFEEGKYTEEERYNRSIEIWTKASEEVKEIMLANFDLLNSVYMMAFSGARGNVDQVRQLAAMRGLMADPSGRIMDIPIKSSFYEGLSVSEHFISSYGARKGVVDTALRTSDSGYLTRRLVDVAQGLVIRMEDCGTDDGIYVEALEDEGKVLLSLKDRIIGRFSAEDVYSPSGELLIRRNEYIDLEKAKLIEKSEVKRVKIRSPMTCRAEKGICQKCYGEDLATHSLVNIGEAVGIIAAQSIGEPGTQLTMRTFHTGGVALTSLNYQNIQTNISGKIYINRDLLRSFRKKDILGIEQEIVRGKEAKVLIKNENSSDELLLPQGSILNVYDGEELTKGMVVASLNPVLKYITSPFDGKIIDIRKEEEKESIEFVFRTVLYNPVKREIKHDETKERLIWSSTVILQTEKGEKREIPLPQGVFFLFNIGDKIFKEDIIAEYDREHLRIQSCSGGRIVRIEAQGEIIEKVVATGEAFIHVNTEKGDEIYSVPRGLKINVDEGEVIEFGTVLAYFPSYMQRIAKTEDIIQGLPRVEELFEARKPKGRSILAPISGTIKIERTKTGERVKIKGHDGEERVIPLPPNAQLLVKEGEEVEAGQEITKGYKNPLEILQNEGLAAVQRYIVDEVQKVYCKQGAEINDKHVEVIVRQMTNKVRIKSPGDSNFIIGQLVNRITFEKAQRELENQGKVPPQADPVVLGITKAALTTESVISAASFQETTRVLSEAAVKGREDNLEGLKENVIIGRLIPAGSGLFKNIVPKRILAKEIAEVLENGGKE